MNINKAVKIVEELKFYESPLENHEEAILTILHHIEHLQKENEELKAFLKRIEDKDLDEANIRAEAMLDMDKKWRNKIREKIDNQVERIEKLLDEMVDKSIGMINVSYLNKKEREEVLNKRNCLLVQKATLIQEKEDLLKEE